MDVLIEYGKEILNLLIQDPLFVVGLVVLAYIAWKLFWFLFRFFWTLYFSTKMVYMKVTLPRNDSKLDKEKETKKDFKEKMAIMDQLYRGVYEIRELNFKNRILSYLLDHDTVSFEMVVQDQELSFYIVAIPYYAHLVEKQITSLYVDAEIEVSKKPYKYGKNGNKVSCDYIYHKREFWFPIKTYKTMEEDPFNSIANNLSVVEKNEEAIIQICLTPRNKKWRKKAEFEGERIFQRRDEKSFAEKIPLIGIIFSILRMLLTGETQGNLSMGGPDPDQGDRIVRMLQTKEENAKKIGEKANQVGFDVSIRLVVTSPKANRCEEIINSITVAFNQFKDPSLNWFENFRSNMIFANLFNPFIRFTFDLRVVGFFQSKSLLDVEELSSVFHLPDQKYNPIPIIKWLDYKVVAAPVNLPKEGILLGHNVHRGIKREIRFADNDRTRHHYVIGKSGTGKSEYLFYMARQDIERGKGVCVVDPHGDLVEDLLKIVPKERAKDVIYFDPADKDRPVSLNMLEVDTPDQMDRASLDAMEIFIKLFGNEIFGPRIQHYFRNACLTLMADQEEGATVIDVPRIFVDDEFMKYKVAKVTNPVVKSFWEHEYAKTGAREKEEMIPYFSSKFGPFITNTTMRNIIGQKKSAFNFRQVMDEGKILLINLSKGSIGAVNAQLLGLIVVNKLNQAALSRTDIPKEQRKDFYLYVDEFQNFATETFATILSEARKYKLCLIMAHQYINQLVTDAGYGKGQTSAIRDAVFGNVGTMSSFKVGAEDAEYLEKEYAPVLSQQDIIGIAKYKTYTKLNIDNSTTRPFSMDTIFDHSGESNKLAKALKKYSRLKYGRKREFVDQEIEYRLGIQGEFDS